MTDRYADAIARHAGARGVPQREPPGRARRAATACRSGGAWPGRPRAAGDRSDGVDDRARPRRGGRPARRRLARGARAGRRAGGRGGSPTSARAPAGPAWRWPPRCPRRASRWWRARCGTPATSSAPPRSAGSTNVEVVHARAEDVAGRDRRTRRRLRAGAGGAARAVRVRRAAARGGRRARGLEGRRAGGGGARRRRGGGDRSASSRSRCALSSRSGRRTAHAARASARSRRRRSGSRGAPGSRSNGRWAT